MATVNINIEDIDTIVMNSPDNVTFAEAVAALQKSNNNIVDAIALLWNIEKVVQKEKTKLDELRETCNAFDTQMQELLKKTRENQAVQEAAGAEPIVSLSSSSDT